MSRPDFAALLYGHRYLSSSWQQPHCSCGYNYGGNPNASEYHSHPAHLAAALDAAVDEWLSAEPIIGGDA